MNENKDEKEERNELINTAVKFLINPSIQGSTEDSKRLFLKKKGLTDDEIKSAFSRAAPFINQPPRISHTAIQIPPQSALQVSPHYQVSSQLSWYWKIRDILHSIALISGFAYAIYWFYQKYIYPYLFGKPKDKSTLDSIKEIEESLNKNVIDVKSQLIQVQQKLDTLENANERNATYKQLNDLKTEITTVKGLLLNRKQFPSANNGSPMLSLGQPSIPAWQLSENENLGKTSQNLENSFKVDESDETKSNNLPKIENDISHEVIQNGNDSNSSLESEQNNTSPSKSE